MRPRLDWPNITTANIAPALIAAGLAILLAHACWPVLPAVTALAFVALGTTLETIARCRRIATGRSAVALHLFVYASLYLLFIGAICDAAMRGPRDGITFLQGVDFGVSAAVMLFVVRTSIVAMTGGEDAPAR